MTPRTPYLVSNLQQKTLCKHINTGPMPSANAGPLAHQNLTVHSLSEAFRCCSCASSLKLEAHRETVRTRGATSGGGLLASPDRSSQTELTNLKVLHSNNIALP